MNKCLMGPLRPVRIISRSGGRSSTVFTILFLVFLIQPLPLATTNHNFANEKNPLGVEQFPPLKPGQVKFDHLTSAEGLAEDRVWGITQDRRGFMWFTSMDGINRYDGYEFVVYKYDPANPNSPESSIYRRVLEDSRGMLWFGSLNSGLSRFDPVTEQWTNFRGDPGDPNSLSGSAIWALAEDQSGNLWIGTEAGGLNRFNLETEQFTHYRHDPDNPNSISGDQVLAVEIDHSGVVWAGTQYDGLNRFDPESGKWTHHRHDPADPESLSYDHILSLYEDRSGVLWVGTWGGGLDRLDGGRPGKGVFRHYQHDPNDPASLSNNHVAAIHQDQSGTLWVATFGGGLDQMISDRDSIPAFAHHQYNSNDLRSLSHNLATSIYEDRTGILWVGTAGGAINKLDLRPKAFSLYQHIAGDPNSLSSNDIRAVRVSRSGDLWIGTYGGGLNRVERHAGSDQSVRITKYQNVGADSSNVSPTNIVAIEEDQDGMLWIGTAAEGFFRFDPETETFVHYEPDPNSPEFRPSGIRAIYEDKTGGLWFGSWGNGLGLLDRQTGEFKVYIHDPDVPMSISGNTIFSIFEDQAGALWVGTLSNGLNRFDRDTETFTRYQHDINDPQSLNHNTVTTINQDQHGDLWVGTGGGGINRFDHGSESFSYYTENDGLPSNTIHAILAGDDGALWISSAGGLSRFDPQTSAIRNYTKSDGLQGNQFIEASACKNQDGELFFGGPNGLTSFYPNQIQDDETPPPISLTNIRLNYLPVALGSESVLKRSIFFTDELTITPDEKIISFDFSPLSYRSPERNRCRYMLEGFDQDWTEVGSTKFSATYTNLDPGGYVFRVIGSNGDGVWNEEGVSIKLTILPPWWGTWWFRGALLFSIIALLAGGYYWRLWNLERRSKELEIQVAQRTLALEVSEKQYRDLIENINEVIYSLDTQGVVTYVSPAVEAFIGYSPSEVIGKHLSAFIYPDDLRRAIDRFEQYSAGESLLPQEYRLVSASGDTRWIEASGAPVFDGDQVMGVRGVLSDITERKQLQEQREQAAALAERERLARDLHDAVSQTLYSIAAIAEALPNVWERQPDLGRQGLQDLGRLASGALAEMRTLLLELRPATITQKPMGELLRQLVEAAEGHTQTSITLTLTGDYTFPVDVKIALFRIAQEGLNNIIKHARASQIKLGLYCQPGRVILGISDNGRGFDSQGINSGQFGITFMRERAKMIGAEFSLETEPTSGTEITVIWIDPSPNPG